MNSKVTYTIRGESVDAEFTWCVADDTFVAPLGWQGSGCH